MPYIFDDIASRTLEGGADRLIPDFDYLNESNRVEAERVRLLIEDFVARYPLAGRAELRARLRSRDDVTHKGAFFELAMHELILRAPCQATLHPAVPGTRKTPDFLVQGPDGRRFYLEATLATGRSTADDGAQKRMARALQTVDEVPSPDFFLSVSTSGMPTAPITGKRLKRKLTQWLARLDYAVVSAAIAAGDPEPTMTFTEHGLQLRFAVIPRGSTRGRGGRAIGSQWLPGGVIHPNEPIADAVCTKAGRYGRLDLPYVIAVNALDIYSCEDSAIDALFGSPAVEVTTMSNGSYRHRHVRRPDGALSGAGGPERTRVSAILSVDRLTPWNISQSEARLILNPWAQRSLDGSVFPLPCIAADAGRLRSSPGTSLAKIFDLWPGWPEEPARQGLLTI